jgi:hypothetical protein
VGSLRAGHFDARDGPEGFVSDAAMGGLPAPGPCHRPTEDRDRLAFLAEVSDVMIRSLDTGETADRPARLAVPRLAGIDEGLERFATLLCDELPDRVVTGWADDDVALLSSDPADRQSAASSLVGRLARLGCTRIGSPGIFG